LYSRRHEEPQSAMHIRKMDEKIVVFQNLSHQSSHEPTLRNFLLLPQILGKEKYIRTMQTPSGIKET